jgi:CheY-like chemotaxis protein
MQFLVTTNDIIAGRMFCRIAEELRATVEFRDDAKSSLATLEQQRFDVVVIDCDDVYQGNWLLRTVRKTRANKSSVLVAVTGGATQAPDALDLGANIVIAKPLLLDQVRSKLHEACATLVIGHRRDRRHAVRLPVFLSFGQVLDRRAETFNLSIGGLGVHISDPIDEDEIIQIRFSLPGSAKCIQARGEVAWADREGNIGIKFIGMSQESSNVLAQWLDRTVLGVTITNMITTTMAVYKPC